MDDKNKVFEEPQIFNFECIVTYKSEDESECEYPEYSIKAYSYDEVFNKIQEEIQEYINNYDEELFYASDWEVLSWEIDNTIDYLDYDLTINENELEL